MLNSPASQGSPLIASLLGWAAGNTLPFNCCADDDGLRQLRWLLDGGLGPLLYRASREAAAHGGPLPPGWREQLLAADLCARMRHASLLETLGEVIEACRELGVALTLLKGISVSSQWYPEGHLRPMGDIDVLLAAADYGRVERALQKRGCVRVDEPEMPGRQHGVPLCHEASDTIIELHTRLFEEGTELSEGTLFDPGRLPGQARGCSTLGEPVRRFTPELQLAYIASSWFNDMTNHQVHPSFLASLFDAVFLLSSAGDSMDWPGLVDGLDNEMATASLHVLLSFLPRYGVPGMPSGIAPRLAARQSLVGPLQLGMIHRMLDHHLVAGRPWSSRLPPPVPGRYSLQRQFRKRLLGR